MARSARAMICLHLVQGDLRSFLIGKMEFAGRDAAEGDAFKAAFISQLKAGTVAACQQFLMLLRQRSLYDGANGMDHIPAGQVEAGRDFRLSCRFWVSLD